MGRCAASPQGQVPATGLDSRAPWCYFPAMDQSAPHLTMSEIREQIDRIDEQLIKLLAERQRWIEKAIVVKKRDGIPARVPARIDQVIDNVRVLARAHKVDAALVEVMWTEMVEWFVAHEERTLGMK